MKTSLVIAVLPAFLLAFAHGAKADEGLKVLKTRQGAACRDFNRQLLLPKILPPTPPFDARPEPYNTVVPVNKPGCHLDRGDVKLNKSLDLDCPPDASLHPIKQSGVRGNCPPAKPTAPAEAK